MKRFLELNFESRKHYLFKKCLGFYNSKIYRRSFWNLNPHKILINFLDNNIGNDFDISFSYYCHKYPKQSRVEFLKQFEVRIWYGIKNFNYCVDENGLIQEPKREKKYKSIYVRSFDYKPAHIEPKYKYRGMSKYWQRIFQKQNKPQQGWIKYFKKKDSSYIKCRIKSYIEYRNYKKDLKIKNQILFSQTLKQKKIEFNFLKKLIKIKKKNMFNKLTPEQKLIIINYYLYLNKDCFITSAASYLKKSFNNSIDLYFEIELLEKEKNVEILELILKTRNRSC